jgi:chromosome segregation ATPase
MASQESLILMAFLMIAFLIGFITARVIALRKASALQRTIDTLSQTNTVLEADLTAINGKFSIREADLKRNALELERTVRQLREKNTKAAQLQDELGATILQLEKTEGYKIQLEVQLQTLQKALASQQREIDAAALAIQAEREATEELRKRLGNIDEEKVTNLQQEVNSLNYVKALLEQERDDLQKLLTETGNSLEMMLQKRENEDSKRVYVIGKSDKDENSILLSQKDALKQLEDLIGEVLPYADKSERDELKHINGIGPFIEEKLNAVGIFTYEQISMFDDDFINVLTAAIGFFPERIKRGRWVEQAQELWGEKEQEKLSLPHRDPDLEVNGY